jgi:hypothetical protein
LANLRDEDEEGISLFPMFNILACTLGVMVFILATVATVSLGADKAVEVVEGVPTETLETELVSPTDSTPATAQDAGRALTGERRAPLWLEWDGNRLLRYPEGDSVVIEADLRGIDTWEETWNTVSNALTGTRIGNAIAQAAIDQLDRQYVVLLVRPSGFDELLEVRSYFEFLGLDVGFEPINQEWQRLRVGG